ncbi:MAG: tetratricopeptide repeat protein [Coleofasciculaceae cyanobacterium]
MALDVIDWDEDVPADPEEEYQTFVRTLKRTDGFRLLFVQCTPAQGTQLIAKVKADIPQKTVEFLQLHEPIDNLYKLVELLPNREEINILFIQGLEYSFYEYETTQFGRNTEHNFYGWEGVPQILNHLNQHRERFRDDFNICFVFLLRSFAFKYFIHRAPDFFDWRSSVFEFPTKKDLLEQECSRIIQEGDYQKYCSLTLEEQVKKVLEIQELLAEKHQQPSDRARLQFELGILLDAAKEYEEAIASYDQSLQIKPDDNKAWVNRGNALRHLGRFEEAIASYDKSVEIKPDKDEAWYNRGMVLRSLGRFEEAISSYDQALKLKPDYYYAWNHRGMVLWNLGRFEEAISSYDQALKLKPDLHSAWYNRGIALRSLGRFEEAVASYDQALKIQPDFHQAWQFRGLWLEVLGRCEEAIASFDKALEIQPNYYLLWSNRGTVLRKLGRYEEANTSYDKALELKSDSYWVWYWQSNALLNAGHYEEALSSYDTIIKEKFGNHFHNGWHWSYGSAVLEFKSDPSYFAWYGRAISLHKLGRYREAITSYKRFLINPDIYQDGCTLIKAIAQRKLGWRELIEALLQVLEASGFKR